MGRRELREPRTERNPEPTVASAQSQEPENGRVILSAVIHREDDLSVAECPELGTVSQGRTIEEAAAAPKEATGFYL